MKVGFIGLGNMAGAIMNAIIKSKKLDASDIIGYDTAELARNKAAQAGIEVAADNKETAEKSDILFLSVKPQFYTEVIEEIRESISEKEIIVTIAPGKTLKYLDETFNKEIKAVRCMPNTPALVLEGCTGVCPNSRVTPEELNNVLELLNSFGKANVVPERLMDTVGGVSGSSPAYVFMFIEALADAAVACGMPRNQAYEFAAQSVYGSAKMVLELNKHPGELKDMVCSPAGTTIQGVRILEERGFRAAVMDSVIAAIEKSKAL